VVDDAEASFWSEFQRLGGVELLGYPISNRFQSAGMVTQAFQRTVLRWQPDLGQAVPVNVLDDLGARGADAWLDRAQQVPPDAARSADLNQPSHDDVAQQVALLDAFPALRDFYEGDPNLMALYGLPVSVKEYGSVVSVRLQ